MGRLVHLTLLLALVLCATDSEGAVFRPDSSHVQEGFHAALVYVEGSGNPIQGTPRAGDFDPPRHAKPWDDMLYLSPGSQDEAWLYFESNNQSDTARRLFFFFGNYKKICVYRHDQVSGRTISLQPLSSRSPISTGIFPLVFAPGSREGIWIYTGKSSRAAQSPVFAYCAVNRSEVVQAIRTWSFAGQIENLSYHAAVFILSGLILGLLCYALFNYRQRGEIVFLFYAAYLSSILLYSIHRSAELWSVCLLLDVIGPLKDVWWQPLSFVFYFAFAIHFIDFRKLNPSLHTAMRVAIGVLVLYLLVDLVLMLTGHQDIRNRNYTLLRPLTGAFSLVVILRTLFIRDRLAKILSWGSLMMVGGALAAFTIAMFPSFFPESLYRHHMLLMFGGVGLEIIFFTAGLSIKSKLQHEERLALELALRTEREEAALAMQRTEHQTRERERDRVAQELHDDLGSGLTSIRFLSDMIGRDPSRREIPGKIAGISTELIANMRQIVWTMKSEARSFPSFVSFVKEQVSDTLEQRNIASAFSIHDETQSTPLILEHQLVRQMWLCIKECIHNAIRHSGASQVDISFHKSAGWIEIGIHDNGKGVLTEDLGSSRGIAHIRQRMESLGGSMNIHGGAGTSIRLRAPLIKAGTYTTKG